MRDHAPRGERQLKLPFGNRGAVTSIRRPRPGVCLSGSV